MKEVQEADMLQAIKVAHEAIKQQCQVQIEPDGGLWHSGEAYLLPRDHDEELHNVFTSWYDKVHAVATAGSAKHERMDVFAQIVEEFKAQFTEEEMEEKAPLIDRYYHASGEGGDAPHDTRRRQAPFDGRDTVHPPHLVRSESTPCPTWFIHLYPR